MSWIKSGFVVLISFCMSLLGAEVVTRIVVGDPVNINSSGAVVDENFGYKVNSNVEDVDRYGFRNLDGKNNNYELATIGDSHTYGFNVSSNESWPYQFESLVGVSVYNMGIGGNGIYSYHYLVTRALKESKKVIVGLYLPNDFQSAGYVCSIDFANEFWSTEIAKLNLSPPRCKDISVSNTVSERRVGLKQLLIPIINSSSFLSLVKTKIYNPIRSMTVSHNEDFLVVHPKFAPIKKRRLERHSENTDITTHSVKVNLDDFRKMLRNWVEISSPGQIGIILIPSRQAVYRTAIERLGDGLKQLYKNELVAFTSNEFVLENLLVKDMKILGIPFRSTRMNVVDTFMQIIPESGLEDFYPDSGHPGALGYSAYASSAVELFLEMEHKAKATN